MKVRGGAFVLVVFTITLIACRKDDPAPEQPVDNCDTTIIEIYSNDTIFPSDYLMAYPGSWWQYSDGSLRQSTTWESLPICQFTKPDCYEVTRTYQILPHYNGVWINDEYSVVNDSALLSSNSNKIVGGTEGEVYSSYREGDYRHTTKCVEYIDSLVVNGVSYSDVLRTMYTYDVMDGTVSMGTVHAKTIYYAKNVGAIKMVYYDLNGISNTADLVNYYIEPY